MQIKINFPLDQIAIKRIGNHSGNPTIVFLHDSLGCIELWRDFPQKLSEITQCNVLVYDRQGYGKSCGFSYSNRDNAYLEWEADILNKLLDYWKIDNAILYGHSDGGSIALISAAKFPEKISGIITEGAHIFVENITVEGIKEAVQLYENSNLKSKLEKYHGDKTDAMFWAWAKTWTSDEFSSWNIEQFLPAVICPSLIIQGENDEYGTLNQVEQIISQTNDLSSKCIVPNAKHTPHKEFPEFILKKTKEFIEQIKKLKG